MSINHIITPLDSSYLDTKEHYVFYHRMVDFALKELIVSAQREQLCTAQEVVFFKQYADLLIYSIEAMRIKYMYDDEDNMKVDLTESGFPNYLEFRYLYNDLALRENYIDKLKDVSQLQEEFLDTLLRKKEPIKKSRLFQAASIVYYTSVDQKLIFNRFVQGKIIKAPKDVDADYMTSWSFFDVGCNRPFICFMYFNYEGSNVENSKDQLYGILKESADRDMALDTMAFGIDRKLKDVKPKLIKRIDLGPFHNIFTKDENEITHAILKSIADKDVPLESYALSLRIDEVVSGREFSEGGYFTKQTLQKWNTPIQKNYVLVPHRIIQLLYSKTPDIMNGLTKPPIQIADLKVDKL